MSIMTDANEPPAVGFSELERSNSIQKTFHVLWPYLVEQVGYCSGI